VQVYEHLRQQEISKQAEMYREQAALNLQAAEFSARQEELRQQEESKRERARLEMQRQLADRQAQFEAQKLKEQGEIQRRNNNEYLQKQKQISLEVEHEKLAIQQKIEAERKATSKFEVGLSRQLCSTLWYRY
jgi:hypothetical protein